MNSELFSKLKTDLDPFELVKEDMKTFSQDILEALYTGDSSIDDITQYYFKFPGKHFRPTILLLLSRALSPRSEFLSGSVERPQRVFAEVIEMMHCSSLVHDDVIDRAETRRGQVAVHKQVGNFKAVKGGNYLMGTASYHCTKLDDMRLMNLISEIMENLSKGELIQADAVSEDLETHIVSYCHKTYFKTASLIAHGCKGIGYYGGYPEECFNFGKHLGLAFQYVDDVLDFVGDQKLLGKPKLNDMREGLATGPVLFGEGNKILDIVKRKFSKSGDIELGVAAAEKQGIDKTRHLALLHLHAALDSLHFLDKNSFAYKALCSLASKIYNRVS